MYNVLLEMIRSCYLGFRRKFPFYKKLVGVYLFICYTEDKYIDIKERNVGNIKDSKLIYKNNTYEIYTSIS